VLINIYPLPIPHQIEVNTLGTATKTGWLTDSTDFETKRLAFNALAQVVEDGLYILEDERSLDYNIHVDELNEFWNWLTEGWESIVIPDGTIRRTEEVFRGAGQSARLVLITPARMTRLRVVGKPKSMR
jgi:hypothetical protein